MLPQNALAFSGRGSREVRIAKTKTYVVWKGHTPGVYLSWPDCQKQVNGFSGAKYKGFSSIEEAFAAFSGESYSGGAKKPNFSGNKPTGTFLTVDAAFSQKTKILEWRGVLVEGDKKTEVFHSSEQFGGSANIGEFLAIIDGIDYLLANNLKLPIYSDSYNAQIWIKRKAHNANVEMSDFLISKLNEANARLSGGMYTSVKSKLPIKDWVKKMG